MSMYVFSVDLYIYAFFEGERFIWSLFGFKEMQKSSFKEGKQQQECKRES